MYTIQVLLCKKRTGEQERKRVIIEEEDRTEQEEVCQLLQITQRGIIRQFLEHQLSGIFMLGLLIWDPRCAEKSDLISVALGSQSTQHHMKQLPVYSQLEVFPLK